MYNLFLDDERIPYSPNKEEKCAFAVTRDQVYYKFQWEIVRSYNEFIEHVDNFGIPERVSLDFDLRKCELKNGLDCLKWIISHCSDLNLQLPEIFFHSANENGKALMKAELQNHGKVDRVSKTIDNG